MAKREGKFGGRDVTRNEHQEGGKTITTTTFFYFGAAVSGPPGYKETKQQTVRSVCNFINMKHTVYLRPMIEIKLGG